MQLCSDREIPTLWFCLSPQWLVCVHACVCVSEKSQLSSLILFIACRVNAVAVDYSERAS